MLKTLVAKKEYIVIIVIAILFLLSSSLSINSINQLQGNARVINYVGFVRGATQKLVKEELMNYPDNLLMSRLDGIVNELITGQGVNNLTVLPEQSYLDSIYHVQQQWLQLRKQIFNVRVNGSDEEKIRLNELSEHYFILVNKAAHLSEIYAEQQVNSSKNKLIIVNIIFLTLVLLGIISIIRTLTFKKRAECLNKIAYIDPLTQIPNRAHCQRKMAEFNRNPPLQDIATFMFDMNNLKIANDQLGHQVGDRIIVEFAKIISSEGKEFGFVGRYGGDEFVAFIPHANKIIADRYLSKITEKIATYNKLQSNELEKISFAAGYFIGNVKNSSMENMINKADRCMYAKKHKMKENLDGYIE